MSSNTNSNQNSNSNTNKNKNKEKRVLPTVPKTEDPTAKVLAQLWSEMQSFRKDVNTRLTCIEEYILNQKKTRKRIWNFTVNILKKFGVPASVAVISYLIGRFFGVEIDGTINLTYIVTYI